jgi:hypothetical protein
MTWVDEWPEQVVADTNRLMDYVGPFARKMVRQDGIVLPCGAGITGDGRLEPFITDPSGFATMGDAYEFLLSSVVENRDDWRAVCSVIVITDEDRLDALRFWVEHVSGQSAMGIMGFRRKGLFLRVYFDELKWIPAPSLIWSINQDADHPAPSTDDCYIGQDQPQA